MGDGERFEDTMDVLEARREETEGRFRELLERLAEHVGDVRSATEQVTTLYAKQVEERREALASVRDGLTEACPDEAVDEPAGWPKGGGPLRRFINRVSRWLLRDFLEVLDRRGDAGIRRVELLGDRVEVLRERVDVLQSTMSPDSGPPEALGRALEAAHEALQGALATHAEMLDLVNAKDAEVLQRAVAGPLRRMEVLFDEFGRQQEALLSQLVGRRRELDRLVRSIDPSLRRDDGVQ